MKVYRMKVALVGVLSLAVWGLSSGPAAAEPAQVWEATGFKGRESAIYDGGRSILYVSNVNGGPGDKDGNGFISRLGIDGKVLEESWVTGLDGPKGMALYRDRLYVSDIDRLVEIDVNTGAIVGDYAAPGSKFLNDVAVDRSGRVYVSDMMDDAIYRLDRGTFALWLKDEKLEFPNGLLVDGDRLLVAAWGVMTDGWGTKTPGHLKSVSLSSKAISSLGSGAAVGNLDGLEADGRGSFLVTDWMAGGLYRIAPSGKADLLLDLNQGSADLEYLAAQGLAIVPMMMDGKVTAYKIE